MDKHFEPVTAKSLAEKIQRKVIKSHYESQKPSSTAYEVEQILEPHIRKPSDDVFLHASRNKILNILAICRAVIKRSQHTYLCDSIDQTLEEYGKKAEDYVGSILVDKTGDKSVPARCEEAYNEVILLLKELSNNLPYFTHDVPVYRDFKEKIISVLRKPNPFKEADIVRDDVDVYMDILEKERSKPQRYPFDLGLEAKGHKVVTRDGLSVKIISDSLFSPHPILAIITHGDGDYARFYDKNGVCASLDERDDLFILKEPEPVDINIYRLKETDDLFVWANDKPTSSSYELIKTIKTTI